MHYSRIIPSYEHSPPLPRSHPRYRHRHRPGPRPRPQPSTKYPHVLEKSFEFERLRNREISIRKASCAFRELENWTEKLKDRGFVADWLFKWVEDESLKSGGLKVLVWNKEDVEYWFEEVKGFKKVSKRGGGVEGVNDGVWKRDGAVEEELRRELMDAVAILGRSKDQKISHIWSEPGAAPVPPPPRLPMSFALLDPSIGPITLLNPSMYPVVYNKTLIFKNGELQTVKPPRNLSEEKYSTESCWLPTDFEISPDGKSTKILSYINNLSNPGQGELFHPILERVFTGFVPLFDHLLAEMAEDGWRKSRCEKRDFTKGYDGYPNASARHKPGRGWYRPKLYALRSEYLKTFEEILGQFKAGEEMNIDILRECVNYDYDIGRGDKVLIGNQWKLRSGGKLTLSKDLETTKLEGKTVKVFVRILGFEVTPKSIELSSKKWVLPGSSHERIIATGVYCYSQENVADARIGLRRNDFTAYRSSRLPKPQEIDGALIKENRTVVFTSNYEYCLFSEPLRLIDKTKPGHLKMLMFHLVDPDFNLLTTKDIPPQQPGLYEKILRTSGLGRLPEDVFAIILGYLNIPNNTTERMVDQRELMVACGRFFKSLRNDTDSDDSEDDDDVIAHSRSSKPSESQSQRLRGPPKPPKPPKTPKPPMYTIPTVPTRVPDEVALRRRNRRRCSSPSSADALGEIVFMDALIRGGPAIVVPNHTQVPLTRVPSGQPGLSGAPVPPPISYGQPSVVSRIPTPPPVPRGRLGFSMTGSPLPVVGVLPPPCPPPPPPPPPLYSRVFTQRAPLESNFSRRELRYSLVLPPPPPSIPHSRLGFPDIYPPLSVYEKGFRKGFRGPPPPLPPPPPPNG
ncbi:hypothetical protein TWF225_011683 [Orbilia oligospora]|nr:hypothetical protein TWF225_011683 [Orbilia oligospora]KAF3244104.1 hypothetical protein TWF128_009808 [Orbilia oligospora]KAF3244643.1 hypothetical protein TWF217_010690 [Orbilia oligospora]